MRGSDFNYKVALASGLRSLQAGQVRKAEEQFRYLREKFPHADGGYRGLAKVAGETGDLPGALVALREGAAALARAGERSGAIGLLREILTIEPLDHAAHRRVAAALILAGDRAGAAAEYERYTELLGRTPGGAERARLELAYAREQLGADAGAAALDAGPSHAAAAPVPAVLPPAVPPPAVPPPAASAPEAAPAVAPPPAITPTPAPPAVPDRAEPAAPRPGVVPAIPAPAFAAPPAVSAVMPGDDLEARAARALAGRDDGAAPVILAAARDHIAAGRLAAANDLLLHTVAAGIGVHDAERLMVEVATLSGEHALAAERTALLARLAQT